MKSVTIPTCANPFVVIVNGVKYFYPAGETVEVPDDVAAVIEQHDEAHNNPAPTPVVPPFVPGEGSASIEAVKAALAESGQIGYIGKKKEVVFPQEKIFILLGNSVDMYTLPITPGKQYTIVYDGTQYTSIAQSVDVYDGDAICIGNCSSYSSVFPNTGEPCGWLQIGSHSRFIGATDGDHTFEIYTEEDVIVPIDPKFLPSGGGEPYITFTYSVIGFSEFTLDAETADKLLLAYNTNTPVYFDVSVPKKFDVEPTRYKGFANIERNGSQIEFKHITGNFVVIIQFNPSDETQYYAVFCSSPLN